jgi:hypothetical protein
MNFAMRDTVWLEISVYLKMNFAMSVTVGLEILGILDILEVSNPTVILMAKFIFRYT